MAAAPIESESPDVLHLETWIPVSEPELIGEPRYLRALARRRLVAAQLLAELEKREGRVLGGMVSLLLDAERAADAAEAAAEGREVRLRHDGATPEETAALGRLVRTLIPHPDADPWSDVEREALVELVDALTRLAVDRA